MLKEIKDGFLAGWNDASNSFAGKKHYRVFWLGILDVGAAQLDSPRRVTVTNPANGVPATVPEIVAEVMKKHSDFAAVFVQPFSGTKDYGCLVWKEENSAIEATKRLIQVAKDLPFAYLGDCGYRQFVVQLCVVKGQKTTKGLETDGKIILSQMFEYTKNDNIILIGLSLVSNHNAGIIGFFSCDLRYSVNKPFLN